MAIMGDYHIHSTYSHGKGSVAEIVARAREIGLKEIGITDHGICNYPNNLRPHEVDNFLAEVKAMRDMYSDINVYAGIEANLIALDGSIDMTDEQEEKLDYIICGYHSIRAMKVSPRNLFKFFLPNLVFTKSNAKMLVKNTDAYINAMERRNIAIIAHPLKGIGCDLTALAEACKQHGVHIEVNEKNLELEKEHFDILVKSGCKLIINSDAHTSKILDALVLQ